MLDWFTGYVGFDASGLQFGRFLEFDAAGEVIRDRDRWETAEGSYESGIQVCRGTPTPQMYEYARHMGMTCPENVLRLSGNPSKYLQGHNVAGPSVRLLGPLLQDVVCTFPEYLRPPGVEGDFILPPLHRSRVDITTSVNLDTHQGVHDYLKFLATNARSRHRGQTMTSGQTVYFGKNSRRWSLKFYCKHCELEKNKPADLSLMSDLLDFTRPLLRVELTLRRPELKDRGSLDESIIWEFVEKIEAHIMKKHVSLEEVNLKPVVKAAYTLWLEGKDMSKFYPRKTFYRYRKAVIAELGIDMTIPPCDQGLEPKQFSLSLDELQRREVKKNPPAIEKSLHHVRPRRAA